jgi:hypothetical protein
VKEKVTQEEVLANRDQRSGEGGPLGNGDEISRMKNGASKRRKGPIEKSNRPIAVA